MRYFLYSYHAADDAGIRAHAQDEIRRLAPAATHLEPFMMLDGWVFAAPELIEDVSYVREITSEAFAFATGTVAK